MRPSRPAPAAAALVLLTVAGPAEAQHPDPLEVPRLREEAVRLANEASAERVLEAYRAAAAADTADGYLWRAYGRTAHRAGRFDEAVAALGRARELGVFSPAIMAREIAAAYGAAGRAAEALDWLEQALRSRLPAPHSLAGDEAFASLVDSARFPALDRGPLAVQQHPRRPTRSPHPTATSRALPQTVLHPLYRPLRGSAGLDFRVVRLVAQTDVSLWSGDV